MRLAAPSTTAETIREAAVRVFGREGLGAPLRSVAAEAGVSAGRIVQLFGSKDALHRACDEHVLAVVRDLKREGMTDAGASLLTRLAMVDELVPYVAYIARSVQAGGEHARTFVQHMVDDAMGYVADAVAAGVVRPSHDEGARVRYLTESALGHLALRLSLDAPRDGDELVACLRRHLDSTTLPLLELFTQGFLADRRMLDEYLMYVGDPPAREQAQA